MAARPPDPPSRTPRREACGLLGVGLDGDDGARRVTRGNDFFLVGGSAETHERMQDLVVRMKERLKGRGKRLADLSHGEFEKLAHEALE